MADFDVERHPSHREDHTGLPSFFNSGYAGSNSMGALIQGEGTTLEEVKWIDLSHLGGVQRLPSDPVERKARRIFFLVPHQILTEESSRGIFQTWECGTLGGHIWGSRVSIRSDSGKPFQSISQ